LFHEFFRWLAEDLGKSSGGLSWSQQLHGSLNLWNVAEGTHVLTLMFFAGTIWIIDLRMMGLAFKNVPFSRINDKVLPITIGAFVAMVVTGVITFFGRDPLMYYHDIWFRLKMVFLVVASVNIFWFHHKVQKSQQEWDAMPSPPAGVKLSGAVSMSAWLLVLVFGRLIAYDWYKCDKVPEGSLVYVLEECKSALSYLNQAPPEELPADGGSATDGTAPADSAPPANDAAPANGAAPADAAPAEPAKPEPAKPTPSAPAKPAPGQGG
jgi:hypothetical protein